VKFRRARPWKVILAGVFVDAIAVAITVAVLPGVQVDAKHPVTGYLVLGALFGVLNAIVKPVLQFMALPFLLQSLGAVVIVVDIGVFALLDALTPHLLSTDGALWIALAGLLLGLLSFLLENLFGLTPPIVTDRPHEATES